ncbi:hypothetical protein ASL11_19775 [Paenibacillus sp. Soil750]|nr:hypothetical protein ASL11_19775 [Paenibacillus sp. Soil750]
MPADERKPIINATRMMTIRDKALETREVSTCPQSKAEREIGIYTWPWHYARGRHGIMPADERKPIINATRMMTIRDKALETREVSTCPQSKAEREIGIV